MRGLISHLGKILQYALHKKKVTEILFHLENPSHITQQQSSSGSHDNILSKSFRVSISAVVKAIVVVVVVMCPYPGILHVFT